MLALTASKTYTQWINNNPNFFDAFISSGDIDEATVRSINNWYKYRIICDDEKFTDFFERQLDLVLPRYNKLIRLENTDFDALVNIYRERQVAGTGSETGSDTNSLTRTITENVTDTKTTTRTPNLTTSNEGTTSKTIDTDTTDSGETSSTRTPNLTTTDSGTSSSSSSTETQNHTEGQNSNNAEGMSASVGKQNPQSISYSSGFDSDGMPALDWGYPSSQSQNKNKSSNSGTNESDGTGSSDTTQSGTSANTNALTGTDVTEGQNQNTGTVDTSESGTSTNDETLTGTDTTAESGTHSKMSGFSDEGARGTQKTTNNTTSEIFSGRDSLTPQAALKEAMSYVKMSSAFKWLKEQLEVCFLSIYDI